MAQLRRQALGAGLPTVALVLFCHAVAAASSGDFGSASRCPGVDPYVGDVVVPLCKGHFPQRSSPTYARWVIHFYGERCRRCREGAIALEAALDAQKVIKSALRFGAVDCHDARNERLCKEHRAWKLPVLEALGSGSKYSGSLEAGPIGEWLAELADPKKPAASHTAGDERLPCISAVR
eukprot:TRINITY_DN28432_c0_g1_i1.p3 TRINITY_DN28432_c0_g1~~TRINITY_DN28432_c0_g1_i1.p3  ORF type:complete len:179 (+),score=30.32 TRINITY_DN28432_c0_g1_i1:38-574(+)